MMKEDIRKRASLGAKAGRKEDRKEKVKEEKTSIEGKMEKESERSKKKTKRKRKRDGRSQSKLEHSLTTRISFPLASHVVAGASSRHFASYFSFIKLEAARASLFIQYLAPRLRPAFLPSP